MKIKLKADYIDEEVLLRVSTYAACLKAIAIQAVDQVTGENIATLTCYLRGQSEGLPDDQVIIKNYSENEGLAKAMIDAGLGEVTVRDPMFPRLKIIHPELLGLMRAAREKTAIEVSQRN